MIELKEIEISEVTGGGFWYDLGAFFGKVANANDNANQYGYNQATD